MPYLINEDLPARVRRHLPEHAQTIYREVFNDACDQSGASREAMAHRAAWAAVKRRYQKVDGAWLLRQLSYPKQLRASDD